MRKVLVLATAVVVVTTAVIVAFVPPTAAITFGEADDGRHPNVGSIVGTFAGESQSYQWCTGTLVSPTIVVTASHCFYGQVGVDFTFTLEEVIDTNGDGILDPGVTQLSGTVHINPAYGGGGANDPNDVAVFELDEPSAVTPASLPTAGLLDERAIRSSLFTTVGYGSARDQKEGGQHGLYNPAGRKMAVQSVNTVTKAWITFSMNPSNGSGGTCYGDSGGPHFVGAGATETDIVASVTVTGDSWCRSTDKTYRLDTPNARDFLVQFVPLP